MLWWKTHPYAVSYFARAARSGVPGIDYSKRSQLSRSISRFLCLPRANLPSYLLFFWGIMTLCSTFPSPWSSFIVVCVYPQLLMFHFIVSFYCYILIFTLNFVKSYLVSVFGFCIFTLNVWPAGGTQVLAQAACFVRAEMKRDPNTLFLVGTYSIGKERVLEAVARAAGSRWVHTVYDGVYISPGVLCITPLEYDIYTTRVMCVLEPKMLSPRV